MASDPDGGASVSRVLWLLWFDGWEQAPQLHRRCLESWRLYNKDWEVRTIARRDLPALLGDGFQRYEQLRAAMNPLEKFGGFWIPPAAESDLLRLLLLVAYGGCWVDSTMLCRRPLDEWLPAHAASGFFAFSPEISPGGSEDPLPVMSSFLASAPGHVLMVKWLERVIAHWSAPSHERPELGFFWLHKLFGQLVDGDGSDASASRAWAPVPKVTGEYGVVGPHFWVKYNERLRPKPTPKYQAVIDENRDTPMWKLTNHEVKLNEVGAECTYWCILEDTRRHSRMYASVEGVVLGFSPGAVVLLGGLVAKPELNGKCGSLVAFDGEKGRWQVKLKDGLGTKLFKEQNLEPWDICRLAREKEDTTQGKGES